MWKGSAWRLRTGPRNCGGSKMNMAHERRADEDFRGTAPFVTHVRLQAKSGLVPRPLLNRRNVGRLWRTAGVRDVPGLAPNEGKPPRRNPGGLIEREWKESALDRVGPPPVFGLGGNNGQPHLLAERTGNESPNRMGLPCERTCVAWPIRRESESLLIPGRDPSQPCTAAANAHQEVPKYSRRHR